MKVHARSTFLCQQLGKTGVSSIDSGRNRPTALNQTKKKTRKDINERSESTVILLLHR